MQLMNKCFDTCLSKQIQASQSKGNGFPGSGSKQTRLLKCVTIIKWFLHLNLNRSSLSSKHHPSTTARYNLQARNTQSENKTWSWLFSRVHATLHPALLVRRSVRRSIRQSHFTFSAFLSFLALLLLPKCSADLKYGPCPSARDWGSRVSVVFL